MLTLDAVNTFYARSHILQGVSLEVREHEIVCLLGRNGVGKTTTLKSIMGMVPPRLGVIEFAGKNLKGLKAHDVARRGIGYVPEDRRIFPNLTVLENLRLGMRSADKVDRQFERDRLDRAYRFFPILEERSGQLGRTLSGGEQQMLAIARALMGRPTLMLLDEPSEGLAPTLVKAIAEILVEIRNAGVTILLVEQNARMALKLSDRGYIMEKGRIVFSGSPQDVATSEEAREKLGI